MKAVRCSRKDPFSLDEYKHIWRSSDRMVFLGLSLVSRDWVRGVWTSRRWPSFFGKLTPRTIDFATLPPQFDQ
jgi:hypothetical protein